MQYVGRAIGSVSKTWSQINPATLSGAIDVIVVEQPNGELSCSPFHVRFGKFQILKPSQKKVEVIINGNKSDLPMKLAESGEAYFVFETSKDIVGIPDELLASPVVSAASSPEFDSTKPLDEPDYLDINNENNDLTKQFQEKLNKKLTQIHIPSKSDNNGDLLLDMEGYKPSQDMMHDTDMQLKQLLKDELGSELDISQFIKEDGNGSIRIINPYESLNTHPLSVPGSPSINASEPALDLSAHGTLKSDADESIISTGSSELLSDASTTINTDSQNTDIQLMNHEKEGRSLVANNKRFIKTIRLTSDQLRALGLIYGENDLQFSIDHGKAIVSSKLFVWRWDVPIVISDIDGTITKSDALGHVLAMIGKDWTHPGVAKLFNEIARNGYNILYLTARSAGQADSTRSYLRSIEQDGNRLPEGPVILSPERTMAALRREVILKKPEIFKIACLNDIRSLYFENDFSVNHIDIGIEHSNNNVEKSGHSLDDKNKTNFNDIEEPLEKVKVKAPIEYHYNEFETDEKPTPFFAGFGNRITDALSYRTVGIPSSRIFTINTDGEVHMELLELAGYKSSYLHINELVDHFFPPVTSQDDELKSLHSITPGSPVNTTIDGFENSNVNDMDYSNIEAKSFFRSNQEERFTDVNFWKEPLLNIDDLSDVSSDDNKHGLNSSPIKAGFGKAESQTREHNFKKDGSSIPNSPNSSGIYSTEPVTPGKSREDLGKQIYLELGSPLSSPKMSSVDTADLDINMQQLSISKLSVPITMVSKVSVLDDQHSTHGVSEVGDGNSLRDDEFDDEFDEDEFDEDEFVD